jgi:hypothetical protein
MRTASASRFACLLPTAAWLLVTACGGSTRPSSTTLEGEWTGTTIQGAPIGFTVSADQKMTAITVGYRFGGCAGTQTFADLNLETVPSVVCVPAPCPASLASHRSFNYSSGLPAGPATTVNALFTTTASAEGQAVFRDFPGCGSATGVGWTAVQR